MEVKDETYCLSSLKNHFSIPLQFLMKKARKKIFLLFHLKEVQTQFNNEQFLKSHVFENSKFEKTEQSWPNLKLLSMNHSELKMLFEEQL